MNVIGDMEQAWVCMQIWEREREGVRREEWGDRHRYRVYVRVRDSMRESWWQRKFRRSERKQMLESKKGWGKKRDKHLEGECVHVYGYTHWWECIFQNVSLRERMRERKCVSRWSMQKLFDYNKKNEQLTI